MSSRDIKPQEKCGSCKESPEETKNKIDLVGVFLGFFVFFLSWKLWSAVGII